MVSQILHDYARIEDKAGHRFYKYLHDGPWASYGTRKLIMIADNLLLFHITYQKVKKLWRLSSNHVEPKVYFLHFPFTWLGIFCNLTTFKKKNGIYL